MTTTRSTPRFDALLRWAGTIGGAYRIEVQPDSPETADKIKWLAEGGRPFVAVTPSLQAAVVRYVKADVSRNLTSTGNLRTENALVAAGAAIQAHVILRFAHGGNDVRLRALAPATIAAKSRSKNAKVRANAHKIGLATEALIKSLRASRFVLRKTG